MLNVIIAFYISLYKVVKGFYAIKFSFSGCKDTYIFG